MLLLRVCMPSPQLVEQLLHSLNVLHLQSTGAVITMNQNRLYVTAYQMFSWQFVHTIMISYLGFCMLLSSFPVSRMVFLRKARAVL